MSNFKVALYGAAGFSAGIGSIVSQLTNWFQGPPAYWNAMAVIFFVIATIELACEKHEVNA